MRVDRNVAPIQPKQTRLIRAPLLGTTDSSIFDDEPEDPNTSRFVDPYRTDADQRTAIRQVLDDLNISDEEGRRIFLLALEYEIGAFQQVVLEHLEPIEETGPADERLSDIAKAAKQLLDLLDAACEETRAHILQGMVNADIFNRIADTRYLASLQCEIDRLACACETGLEADRRQQGPVNEASRRFINMLANVYSECFETNPTAEPDEPFAHILKTIVEQTGLPVRFDVGFVEETLSKTEAAD